MRSIIIISELYFLFFSFIIKNKAIQLDKSNNNAGKSSRGRAILLLARALAASDYTR